MPRYVPNSLKQLGHIPNWSPQYSPQKYIPIKYEQKGIQQYVPRQNKAHSINDGIFSYYEREIDSTKFPALNTIANSQVQPTRNTKEEAQQWMDYLQTYPNTYVRFNTSDMILHVESNAAYLVVTKARSRVAGYFHLSDHPNFTSKAQWIRLGRL